MCGDHSFEQAGLHEVHEAGRVMGGITPFLLWQSFAYEEWAAYGQSKLANVLFSNELARKLAHHTVRFSLQTFCSD